MIEKIQMSDAEKNLPSGVPANIRALDGVGNSIQSTIKDIGKAIGTFGLRVNLAAFEEYEMDHSSNGGIMLIQYASAAFAIAVAIIYGNQVGVVLEDSSFVSFFKQNERNISVYRKINNGPLYIKNNMGFDVVVYVRFISII